MIALPILQSVRRQEKSRLTFSVKVGADQGSLGVGLVTERTATTLSPSGQRENHRKLPFEGDAAGFFERGKDDTRGRKSHGARRMTAHFSI
jgi:hypothetical protein